MSSTKRKQKPPERFCEEKRAKMTWTLYDMVSSSYDQVPAATFSTSSASLEDTRRGSLSARRNKKQAGEPKNLELNLDNTLSRRSFCQLGVFNIGLCISKKQQDEVRLNGTNNGFSLSSPNLSDEQCYNGEHPSVVVNLSFETVDLFDENSTKDEVRQVSFRAVVPCHVSKDKLEALVYLQNKGVISLVLSPEQRILKDFWEVIVCLNESGLTKLPVASVDSSNRKTDKLMKLIMAWFYNLSLENDLAAKDYDDLAVEKGFDELYDGIKAIREKVYSLNSAKSSCCDASVTQKKCNKCNGELSRPNGLITTDFQHPNLKPVLRGYQRRAVDWMLKRELGCQLGNQDGESGVIHPLWQEVHTLDGKLIYFNPHTGRLTKERFPLPSLPLGGILADEMGLGKTVEVIACILHHPKPLPDCKSLIDNRTANQKLIASQANGQNPVMSCVEEMFTSSTHAQGNQSHQGQTNNSIIKPACNSHVDSQTAHPCSDNNPMNAANRVACSVQESCSNSQHSECEINNEEGRNQSMVKSGHKILNDARIAPHHSSLCHSYKLSMTETNKSDIQKCSESCEILSQEGTHDSTVKSNQKVDERNCDSELTTCRKGGSHKVVGTVGGENNGSIHKNTIFSKNDCDLPEVNSSQSSNSYSIVLESPGDSGCSNAGTISGKKDSSVFASDESLCSCKNSDSSKTVFCKLHSGTRSENLSNANDQSKDLSKIQVALEVNGLACASHEPTEHKGTIKCQCICGASAASYDDRPLQCCGCQAIFHAKCLQYECPQEFVCPQCALKRPAVPSRATLIISPAPIAQQWVDEIWRHTEPSSLKLLVYEGVAKSGFILPEVLADHDVILTTYSTLRSDFYHLGSKSERSMRYDKRYVALPSPLTGVLFWRICLDEAQMVESTTAKAAEVALHLSSVHRWCVTGTPIQKGLADIYGLLLFLGVDPYCNQRWWKTLLYEPYRNGQWQPLYNVLAKIMWRSAKKDVIHEIQLPAQDETVKWLTFSPVEQHFYRRQHEECAGTAMRMLGNWEKTDTMLSTIDRHTVHQLLNPLLRLRQACCHPQAVRGGYLSMQKSTLTMDKLLESLISKAKLECEEAHRQLLFAFNGLAGVHILKEEWPEAVDMYREAMRSWTEHEATFRTDGLQKLHTLFNLSDILRHHQEVCSRTLRDEKLQDEVKGLKSNYTTRVNTQVTAAQESLDVAKSNIAEIKQKVDFQSPWWMGALHYTAASGLDGDLCHRIKDELSSTDMELGSIGRFTDLRGLQYLLSSKLDLIETTHINLVKALDKLTVMPSTQMVQASAECCLRPAKDSHADRCAFCEVDDIFTEYESRIFGHQGMKGVDEEDLHSDTSLDWHRHGNTGGLRAESEVEKVLRIIHSFIKTNKIAPDAVQEGRHHLNLIESLRKEFKFLRALWFALHERVSCLDELDMCTTRLRLLLPGEPVTDDVHVIHPLQVDQQRLKFVSDRLVAQTELRKKIGQLLYLNNLAKTQTCHGGKNPEPCPVCVKQLGVQWSVFSCGHCICCQCAWVLLRQAGIGPRHRNVHVKCPMCRIPTLAQEISYVSTARTQTEEAHDSVTVKGSHSTKIEAIVRTLLSIKSTDSEAKCLVFSTWQDVLAVLAKALDENGIKYRHIIGSRHFQMNLQTFKQDPLVGVLLLPLQTGSNGLNITEATHVLLVEPALNPAHELQAVGRVHRIGQTKPTHVHRFIIRGTVESRMHSLLQSKPTGCVRTGARDSENSSLTLGDLASLFTQDDDEVDEQCMTGTFGLQDGCEPSVAQH